MDSHNGWYVHQVRDYYLRCPLTPFNVTQSANFSKESAEIAYPSTKSLAVVATAIVAIVLDFSFCLLRLGLHVRQCASKLQLHFRLVSVSGLVPDTIWSQKKWVHLGLIANMANR
jgi:hypothetical protein